MIASDDLKALFRKLSSRFVIARCDLPAALTELDAVSNLPSPYREVLLSFRHNVGSTMAAVTMPYAVAEASVREREFQRFFIAERIRRIGEPENEEADAAARSMARKKAVAFLDSSEGIDHCIALCAKILLGHVSHGDLESGAALLLEQATVLLWSAFEVLARDLFELTVNLDPALASKIASDPVAKSRFQADRIGVDMLATHGFDVSRRMGSILAEQQDFSDLKTIKAVYGVLAPTNTGLRDRLNSQELWLLGQRRHLLIHRRGIVDQAYLRNSGDSAAIGSPLVVTPSYFEASVELVIETGTRMAKALGSGSNPSLA